MAIFATQSPAAGETGLGWSTSQSAGETNSRYAQILEALNWNDKLVFRGMYDYAGSIQNSRSDLTIEGGGGANKGLHITDPTATNVACFRFTGARVHFSDFTITAEPGFNQHRSLFEVRGPDFIFEWGKIDADLANHFTIEHSGQRPIIRRNELSNVSGYNAGRSVNSYAVSCLATVGGMSNGVYEYNYVHHWPHEHFKTIKYSGASGPLLWRIDNNFATDINRDFVDTTGGFRGSGPSSRASISDNILVNIGQSIIDAKFAGDSEDEFPVNTTYTKWVEISRNKCYNVGGLVTATLAKAGSLVQVSPGDYYWRDAIVEDLLCSDNTLQNAFRTGLIKCGLNIRLVNTKRRGSVGNVRIFTEAELANEVGAAVADAVYDHVSDNVSGFYSEVGSTVHSTETVPTAPTFTYGPRSGAAEPSTDPLYVLSGSSFRTNTDLGASSADIMFGVHNVNGADSDTGTITVS